jgi:hypothetical protein
MESGFSQKIAFPALIASDAIRAWALVELAITTASTRGSSSIAKYEAYGFTSGCIAQNRPSTSVFESETATNCAWGIAAFR